MGLFCWWVIRVCGEQGNKLSCLNPPQVTKCTRLERALPVKGDIPWRRGCVIIFLWSIPPGKDELDFIDSFVRTHFTNSPLLGCFLLCCVVLFGFFSYGKDRDFGQLAFLDVFSCSPESCSSSHITRSCNQSLY